MNLTLLNLEIRRQDTKTVSWVGKFVDSSDSTDFVNLSKEELSRTSIYGQLAPLRYKDVEIAVVDAALKNPDISHFSKALEELNCDFYITGEIIKFSNKFLFYLFGY